MESVAEDKRGATDYSNYKFAGACWLRRHVDSFCVIALPARGGSLKYRTAGLICMSLHHTHPPRKKLPFVFFLYMFHIVLYVKCSSFLNHCIDVFMNTYIAAHLPVHEALFL